MYMLPNCHGLIHTSSIDAFTSCKKNIDKFVPVYSIRKVSIAVSLGKNLLFKSVEHLGVLARFLIILTLGCAFIGLRY